MFRHQGKKRTLSHNLKIASLLSFVAGMVNVAGYFAIQRLTTNVTGHFAFFVDEVFKLNFFGAFVYFLYILFFFLGSFVSNFLIEIISRINDSYVYIVPAFIECIILCLVGIYGHLLLNGNQNIIACSLLFAMGLQNSLVTTISNASVRTTHLTGLFTDLGIEVSQLFFYTESEEKKKLISSIKLRLTIISFFFIGGIVGGILYSRIVFKTFLFTAAVLAAGLIYDTVKFNVIVLSRKIKK